LAPKYRRLASALDIHLVIHMNRNIIKAIGLLSLIGAIFSSEKLGAGPENQDIADLYANILIGELFPSGNVYLERFSLDGGFDNEQHFEGVPYAEQIEIHPLKKDEWVMLRASLSRLIKATYIGEIEKNSKYFRYPFSKPHQDALLYKTETKRTDTPLTVISINRYMIEEIIYFGRSDTREYSDTEYETARQHIKNDRGLKGQHEATLAKITVTNTILEARKIALFRIKNVDYEILLSVYHTHGFEYASIVYVIDFLKDGELILTKEKYNIDGPY